MSTESARDYLSIVKRRIDQAAECSEHRAVGEAMKNVDLAEDWLRKAKDELKRARDGESP